jgi:hypothetical protein
MAALTDDRSLTRELMTGHAAEHAFQAADSTQFYKGGLVCLDQADGRLKKGAISTTQVCVGVSQERVLTGASNTRKVRARSGIFGPFNNSAAGDAIAADDIGKDCFIVDDNTVALTSNGSTRSRAGKIYDVDAAGVYVAINFPLNPGP